MKKNNPHDKFVKETLGNVKNAQSFLMNYLPEAIRDIVDMSSLKPLKDSYINEKLEEGFSDLLFIADVAGQEDITTF